MGKGVGQFALCLADLGSIPGTPHGSPNTGSAEPDVRCGKNKKFGRETIFVKHLKIGLSYPSTAQG